jgi:chloramphenicol 3-O phosphotransferase
MPLFSGESIMSNGQTILLNGASSSGKTSIAKALQAMIDEPWIHLWIDDYLGAFQSALWERQEIVKPEWPNIIRGFHAAAAAVARAGNMVIIDDVLEESPPWVESLLELLQGLPVIIVGVHCPLEELEQRERQREDRKTGLARLQIDQVHAQAGYDVQVDSSMLSPTECADRIVKRMAEKRPCSAFERRRQKYSRGSS